MSNRPTTVAQYLASLPKDRRDALTALRKVVNDNIDPAFEEGIQYGMMAWYLPHSRYPAGYHCDPTQPLPFASIASQKNHIGLYLMCVYGSENVLETFQSEWRASGKKLDMGKACVRVKRLEDVPLDVLGRVIARVTAAKFVAHYEKMVPPSARRGSKSASKSAPATGAAQPAAKTAAPKKKAAKKASKKTAVKKVATAKASSKKKTAAKSR